MALEAVVFPQDAFVGYSNYKDLYSLSSNWGYNDISSQQQNGEQNLQAENWDSSSPPNSVIMQQTMNEFDSSYSSPEACTVDGFPNLGYPPMEPPSTVAPPVSTRRKRRRTKICKNKEEVENQRMTHIAVERNRRKQMNEYLAVLRSLMPPSYAQRGDQASIVGGAINYVKELEQLLQSLEAQKRNSIIKRHPESEFSNSHPFAEFFSFPQYSTRSTHCTGTSLMNESIGEKRSSAVADIEVTMVDSHANLKILSRRQPKQLLKIVAGFHCLRLSILHINVTSTAGADHMVLYSFSLKMEDDCQLNSVDEIAAAVNQMLRTIQDEAAILSG
ncbi:Myc-type, basic helix-loop-helix (bHLH) domain [Dillenia turbinata]|uniref:Myc-type, basic helix-loop-helix (BHLH) domain n=1 Tax=Dillenia turbinata TaxID=194707 RepID=A0AAN8W2Y4_9MAGN